MDTGVGLKLNKEKERESRGIIHRRTQGAGRQLTPQTTFLEKIGGTSNGKTVGGSNS